MPPTSDAVPLIGTTFLAWNINVFMSTKNHTIPRYEATLYKIKIFKKWQNVKKKNAISVKIAAKFTPHKYEGFS